MIMFRVNLPGCISSDLAGPQSSVTSLKSTPCHAISRDPNTKERTLDAMVKSGCTIVRSNTFAYNALLRHYAQEGQARQLFFVMHAAVFGM